MAEVARDRHVALLVPDPRIEVWTAQCAGTQAGPRAGVPEPSSSSSMALGATGDQSATSAGVEVMTRRSGYPVRGWSLDSASARGLDRGAQFVWRNTGDSATSWRGWDPPRLVTDWQAAVWTDGSGNLKYVRDPYIVTAQNGDLLVIAQVRETSASGGEYRLECIRRTAASSSWTRVLIEGEATAPTQDYCPCAIVLPSGRVVAYRWRAEGSSITGLRMWYSDDAGLTWSYGGDGVAGRGTTATITRTRIAYSGQQALMLALRSTGDVEQYASSDLGCTFEYVGLGDATNAYVGHDVCPTDDGFTIAYVGGDTSTTGMYIRRLGNAYESFESVVESASIATAGTTSEIALCIDDTGLLHLYVRASGTSSELWVYLSGDNGVLWSEYGVGSGTSEAVRTGDASTYLDGFAATFWRGQVVLAHGWSATPGDEDDSLGIAYFGGYSQVTMPRHRATMSATATAGWARTWLPIELPGDCGWTAAGTAATEALQSPGVLRLNTSAANTRTYTQSPPGTVSQGFMAIVELDAVSGGATTTNQRSVLALLGDGAHQYRIEVRVGTAGYRVYKDVAGTLVGSEQTVDTTAGIQILIVIQDTYAAVWHRAMTTRGGSRSWTAGPSTSTLNDDGAGPATHSLVWGHRATGGAACETTWRMVQFAGGDAVGLNIARGQTNPTDLMGRLFAWRGAGVYVADEVSIQARSGPTLLGEAWSIATAYDYGRDRLLDPRPRRVWRSIDLVDTQRLAFKWSTIDTPFDHGLIGIYLGAKNLGRVTIDWYDQGTTSWVNSATYDLHFDLAYTRSGESVVPNGETPAVGYIPRDEWAGASFEVDDTARKVAHHPDGTWSTARKPRLVLHLDAVDDTETASAMGRIVPRQALLILPITATYSGVRITQVAPDTDNPTVYQGYWEVGRVIVGPVHVLADDPSWGRAIEHQDGAEVSEARDRSRRSRVAAPTRRIVELAWADGVDTSGLANESSRSTVQVHDAASAVGGTPEAVAGLMRAIDGGAGQVVYIPRLTGGHAQVLQRRNEAILCRMAGPVRIETVHGDELDNEVVRVTSFTLEEDV